MSALKKNPSGQGFLIGIGLCYAAPIVMAYLLFYNQYGQDRPNSQGQLLSPPPLIHANGHWQIMALQPSDHPSRLKTITLRWLALGKDRPRVDLTYPAHLPSPTHANWQPVKLTPENKQAIQPLMNSSQNPCGWLIIDPKGRGVLCYSSDSEPKKLDQDLRKLLKTSRIG